MGLVLGSAEMNLKPTTPSTEGFVETEMQHLVRETPPSPFGDSKIACRFQNSTAAPACDPILKKKKKITALLRLLRPKRSSSHPGVSRITVILSVEMGLASWASQPSSARVSLFSHVLPKKTCSALGLLLGTALQGRWAVREAAELCVLVPRTLGSSRHPHHQEKQTGGGSISGVPVRVPGEPTGLGVFQPLGVC